ncbi:MAG: hypothetical protein OXI87_01925 [Albidovulum sp.]|nr:hypothetical protein [Albidovulum sp.]MDE0533135.1 hypothetical protein [Albidovulum sp.]
MRRLLPLAIRQAALAAGANSFQIFEMVSKIKDACDVKLSRKASTSN